MLDLEKCTLYLVQLCLIVDLPAQRRAHSPPAWLPVVPVSPYTMITSNIMTGYGSVRTVKFVLNFLVI